MIFHSYVSLPEGNGISMEHWQKIVVFLALWQWNMAGKYTRFRSMIFPWFSQHVSIGFCQLSPWSPVPPIWKSSARISRIVSLVSSKNHHHWSNSWLSDKLSIYLSIYLYIYRYNDSSALVTSTASIPPRIMVIQCDSTSTRFCSLFAVETTSNQHISTLPQHFPELPTNLWKCGFAWKALRVAIFSSAVTRYISELPSGKRLHNYGKSPCYSWENSL